ETPMKLGFYLHEFWRFRLGFTISLILATVVSVSSAYSVTILPPGLHPRAIGMASASTRVLVDGPKSVLLNLGVSQGELEDMTQRALLLGNTMASLPVRSYIAHRAGVPVDFIKVTPPLTSAYPLPIAGDPQNQRKTTDLF